MAVEDDVAALTLRVTELEAIVRAIQLAVGPVLDRAIAAGVPVETVQRVRKLLAS